MRIWSHGLIGLSVSLCLIIGPLGSSPDMQPLHRATLPHHQSLVTTGGTGTKGDTAHDNPFTRLPTAVELRPFSTSL